mgnify:FL=1
MKNIIIVIVGALIVFFVISKVGRDTPSPVVEDPGVSVPTEIELTSLRGVKIYVTMPNETEGITSPLVVKGRAPGNWFFEASAPVVLTNWDGLIIGQKYITAEGEWMTTDYVPFSGEIVFETPICEADYCKRGSLILQKDNPSGESQFDDAVEMTIKFK